MPPKKSGDSLAGGNSGSTGTKRKFQETKTKTESRSQTPNDALAGPAGSTPGTGNGAASGSFDAGVISFTPMNAKSAGAAGSGRARNGSRARGGKASKASTQELSDEEDIDSIYDSIDERKAKGPGKPPKRRSQPATVEAPSNGENAKGAEIAAMAQGSKIPRKKKSSKVKEPEAQEMREDDQDVEMADPVKERPITELKKKGKGLATKDVKKDKMGASKPSKQSTLLGHFRPLSQETEPPAKENLKDKAGKEAPVIEEEVEAPQPHPKIKIKLKGLVAAASAASQTVPPSNFYGKSIVEKADLPVVTDRAKTAKITNNGVHKETLVLQTNPPSSDTLSESLPSPPVTGEGAEKGAILLPLDTNSAFGRGRRATRNAQPCYSGFPTASASNDSTSQPTATNSRHTSPSTAPPAAPKSGKKATRSASPRRGGKKPAPAQTPAPTTPAEYSMPETALTKTTAIDRRNRAPKRSRCLDESGRFIDAEPPKQAVSYGNPKAGPAPVEYGMLPLGTHPPKERIDEVFNKPVPKEPEPRCDMASTYQFYNLWGTVGNKDVTTMKANQGRAKRMFQKNGKLSADNEWVFPDTEGAKLVTVADTEDVAPGPKGKSKHKRPRLSTSLGIETSTSPSPSFMPDPQLRSTEELVSPVSDNVPETPQELPAMQIDEPEVQQTRNTSEVPIVADDKSDIIGSGVSEVGGLHESTQKPHFLAIIKQAKSIAEKAGNTEIVDLLTSMETSSNTTAALDVINQILRGDMSRRLSPATVPGTKRTALQRDEDEAIGLLSMKVQPGKRHRIIEPWEPPNRPRRPDALDETVHTNMTKIVKDGQDRISKLNEVHIPKGYTCLRGEPDEDGPLLHEDMKDRTFDIAKEDFEREWDQTIMSIQRCQDFQEAKKARQAANGEEKRRRNAERAQDPGASDDEEMKDIDDNPDHLMDDEESPCTVCGGTGAPLVICDGQGCHEEQHYSCAIPPLTSEEVDTLPEWFCRKCTIKKKNNAGKRQNPEYKGTMGMLFEATDRLNPRSFVLPKNIREAFTGVKMGKLGTYKEVIDHFNISKTKDKDLRAYDHLRRLNELPYEEQLNDTDGNLAVCFRCRQSRVRTDRGMLVGCDYCVMFWHQDCLPMPLVEPHAIKMRAHTPPEKGEDIVLMKWKCPLHCPEDAYPIRQPRGDTEGPDFEWPPKHRVPKPPAPTPDVPVENFHAVKLSGRALMLPEKGFNLTFLPNVKKAQEVKELNEQTFTGLEIQAIEALRSLRVQIAQIENAQSAATSQPIPSSPLNPLADFILRNMPDLYRMGGVEQSILNGQIGQDPSEQIRIITAIQKSMEAKLNSLIPLRRS
ncbi:hypothetical protein ABW20_dc0107565 [Dactylellina cionopaga]|nr:hypothetical protein ABW20_dc0107565 [Dactylellina cionopaga]